MRSQSCARSRRGRTARSSSAARGGGSEAAATARAGGAHTYRTYPGFALGKWPRIINLSTCGDDIAVQYIEIQQACKLGPGRRRAEVVAGALPGVLAQTPP